MLTLHQIRQQFAVAIDYTDEDGLTVVRPHIGFDFQNNYVLTYELNDKNCTNHIIQRANRRS